MTTALFREQAAAPPQRAALDLGCEPRLSTHHPLRSLLDQWFSDARLSRWRSIAASNGAEPGAVAHDWAARTFPRGCIRGGAARCLHHAALAPGLQRLAFADAKAYGIGLTFALSETPTSPELPEPPAPARMPHSWMEAHRATDVLTTPGRGHDQERFDAHGPRSPFLTRTMSRSLSPVCATRPEALTDPAVRAGLANATTRFPLS